MLANQLTLCSCYDVMMLATLITIVEYGELVSAFASVLTGVPLTNPSALPVKAEGFVGWGGWMMVPTTLLFWVSALICASVSRRLNSIDGGVTAEPAGASVGVVGEVSTLATSGEMVGA